MLHLPSRQLSVGCSLCEDEFCHVDPANLPLKLGTPAAANPAACAAMPPWLPAFCTHTVKRNPSGPGFVRHWNVEACQEMLASYCAKDYRALLDAPPRGCTLHLVQGEACSQWANEGQGEVRSRQPACRPLVPPHPPAPAEPVACCPPHMP